MFWGSRWFDFPFSTLIPQFREPAAPHVHDGGMALSIRTLVAWMVFQGSPMRRDLLLNITSIATLLTSIWSVAREMFQFLYCKSVPHVFSEVT